jgi:diadenosine tetraphosphate (Ap4A) HIT family hydrolase
MQTAYVIKGRITDEGVIVLDEPAPVATGPVLVTLVPVEHLSTSSGYTAEESAELWSQVEAIAALQGPLPPEDGFSAKDADAILYGPNRGTGNVH